jgi:hypothetical protein
MTAKPGISSDCSLCAECRTAGRRAPQCLCTRRAAGTIQRSATHTGICSTLKSVPDANQPQSSHPRTRRDLRKSLLRTATIRKQIVREDITFKPCPVGSPLPSLDRTCGRPLPPRGRPFYDFTREWLRYFNRAHCSMDRTRRLSHNHTKGQSFQANRSGGIVDAQRQRGRDLL